MKITDNIKYVGVYDTKIDLFESQYQVPFGVTYNSYVILDDKTAVLDTVSVDFFDEWIKNVKDELCGRSPDYLIVHHMEPDHSANIARFIDVFPDVRVVSSAKAFAPTKAESTTATPESFSLKKSLTAEK